MKHYDEMTQSVLARAETERAAQKQRNRKILVSVVICVCCLACVVLIGTRRNAPDPQDRMLSDATLPTAERLSDVETTPPIQGNYSINLLSMTADGSYEQMLENVTMPLYAQFRIRDVRDLTEEERDEAQKEEKRLAEATFAQLPGDTSLQQMSNREAIITLAYVGKITVEIEDYTQVEDISVASTGIGQLDTSTWTGKNYSKRYSVTWFPSDGTRKMIEQDPTLKPSQFRDTITFTIKFKDGTVKTVQVDISFDDEGYAYIVQREKPKTEEIPIPQNTQGVVLLSMAEDGSYTQLENGVILPYRASFRIRDVRGLTAEELRNVKWEERKIVLAAFAEKEANVRTFADFSEDTKAVIMVFSVEKISLMIDDYALVEDVSITTTDVGSLILSYAKYHVKDGKHPRLYQVTWIPSSESKQLIYKDPTIKPSQFRDTITFTITYKDGTVVTKMVDISFDDEGQAYIVQREIKAS